MSKEKTKHIGFQKLKESLQKKGYSEKSAGAIAYTVGKKKYGKAKMAKAAKAGKPANKV